MAGTRQQLTDGAGPGPPSPAPSRCSSGAVPGQTMPAWPRDTSQPGFLLQPVPQLLTHPWQLSSAAKLPLFAVTEGLLLIMSAMCTFLPL